MKKNNRLIKSLTFVFALFGFIFSMFLSNAKTYAAWSNINEFNTFPFQSYQTYTKNDTGKINYSYSGYDTTLTLKNMNTSYYYALVLKMDSNHQMFGIDDSLTLAYTSPVQAHSSLQLFYGTYLSEHEQWGINFKNATTDFIYSKLTTDFTCELFKTTNSTVTSNSQAWELGSWFGDNLILYEFSKTNELANKFTVPDTETPKIAADGDSFLLNVNSLLNLSQLKARFTANDNFDGNITNKLTFETDYPSVLGDVSVGDYYIKASVSDLAGNSTSKTIPIYVRDVTSPVCSLSQSTIYVEAKSSFTSAQALALFSINDNYDKVIPQAKWIITDNYNSNFNTKGTYTISVYAKDTSNNISNTKTLSVVVRDTTKPVANLSQSTINKEVNQSFTSADALALFSFTDNYDEVIPQANWTITDNYNSKYNVLGTYTISAYAKDVAGNQSDTKTLTINVKDTTGAVINLINGSEIVAGHILSDSEIKALFTITDNYDGVIPQSKIVITQNTCTGVAGTFSITVSVTDTNSNISTKSFAYKVVDSGFPVIYVSGTVYIPIGSELNAEDILRWLEQQELITEQGVTFSIISSDFNNAKPGEYELVLLQTYEDGHSEEKKVSLSVFTPVLDEIKESNLTNYIYIIIAIIIFILIIVLLSLKKKKHTKHKNNYKNNYKNYKKKGKRY